MDLEAALVSSCLQNIASEKGQWPEISLSLQLVCSCSRSSSRSSSSSNSSSSRKSACN